MCAINNSVVQDVHTTESVHISKLGNLLFYLYVVFAPFVALLLLIGATVG